jgi:hypothetical protein
MEENEAVFDHHSQKYDGAVKEKMLMKLEKDRIWAKVDSLEANLYQLKDNKDPNEQERDETRESKYQGSPNRMNISHMSGSKVGGSPGKQQSQAKIAQMSTN